MRTVCFKLPKELAETLTELAKSRRATRSALIREALELFAHGGGGSVSALATDLAGQAQHRDGPL